MDEVVGETGTAHSAVTSVPADRAEDSSTIACWSATLGQVGAVAELTVARTVRTRLIAMPARLVNPAGAMTPRGPRGWPWAA